MKKTTHKIQLDNEPAVFNTVFTIIKEKTQDPITTFLVFYYALNNLSTQMIVNQCKFMYHRKLVTVKKYVQTESFMPPTAHHRNKNHIISMCFPQDTTYLILTTLKQKTLD